MLEIGIVTKVPSMVGYVVVTPHGCLRRTIEFAALLLAQEG